MTTNANPGIHGAMPTLPVSDVTEEIAFFHDVLGWRVQFQMGEPPEYAIFVRDETTISTVRRRPPFDQPASCYVFVSHLDAYHAQVTAAGATISEPVRDWPYGMREFAVLDPGGNRITFGEEIKTPQNQAKGKIVSPVLPQLGVCDAARSIEFFRGVLGFAVNWTHEKNGVVVNGEVRSGQAKLQFGNHDGVADTSEQRRARGSMILFFATDDVAALHAAVRARGGMPSELEDVDYWIKMRMFEIRDPDGHSVWFGQETK